MRSTFKKIGDIVIGKNKKKNVGKLKEEKQQEFFFIKERRDQP